jgi:hypothetical protein
MTLHPDANQVGQGVSNISWSSDSEHLSFDLLNGSTEESTSWTLDRPVSAGSLALAEQIPLHPAGLSWGGYLGTTPGGRSRGIGVLTTARDEPPLAGTQQVVSIDPSSGRVTRRLFSLPAAVCTTPGSPSAPSDCNGDFSNALAVDGAGSSVLISGVIPLTTGVVSTSGVTYLYRWETGGTKPVRLAKDVLVATWGPARRIDGRG